MEAGGIESPSDKAARGRGREPGGHGAEAGEAAAAPAPAPCAAACAPRPLYQIITLVYLRRALTSSHHQRLRNIHLQHLVPCCRRLLQLLHRCHFLICLVESYPYLSSWFCGQLRWSTCMGTMNNPCTFLALDCQLQYNRYQSCPLQLWSNRQTNILSYNLCACRSLLQMAPNHTHLCFI